MAPSGVNATDATYLLAPLDRPLDELPDFDVVLVAGELRGVGLALAWQLLDVDH